VAILSVTDHWSEAEELQGEFEVETVSDNVLRGRAKRARAFMQKMVDRLHNGEVILLRSCECGQCMLVEPGPPTGPHYRFVVRNRNASIIARVANSTIDALIALGWMKLHRFNQLTMVVLTEGAFGDTYGKVLLDDKGRGTGGDETCEALDPVCFDGEDIDAKDGISEDWCDWAVKRMRTHMATQ
jgi:hypothetical protein